MLLIITEDNRLLNFVSFQKAHIEEENNTYKLSITGLLEGVRTGRRGTYPVVGFDDKEIAEKALRDLLEGVKKGEWDAKAFKEEKNA